MLAVAVDGNGGGYRVAVAVVACVMFQRKFHFHLLGMDVFVKHLSEIIFAVKFLGCQWVFYDYSAGKSSVAAIGVELYPEQMLGVWSPCEVYLSAYFFNL